MKPVKKLEIVIGICEREGQLLLVQRQDSEPQWDKQWEFPGGKIDSGETAMDAVVREVLEETGLEIVKSTFFGMHHHDWNLKEKILRVHIHCFHCLVGEGEVMLETGKAYTHAWTSLEEAFGYDSLSANVDILKKFATCTNIEHGLK